jgi:hypothetical protein
MEGDGNWIMGTAAENLGALKIVYLNVDSQWALADADVVAGMPVVGITQHAIPVGTKGIIFLYGFIGDLSWTWTPGAAIYASSTAGELTQTMPSGSGEIVQRLGMAYNATMIYFDQKADSTTGGCPIIEGSTAYVGYDGCKESKANYFLCDGVADDVQINAAEAYVTALGGGTVEFERGTYVLADPIIPTGNDIWYKGQGRGTTINGDGLATTEHGFHITGREDIRIGNMAIQTENGGGKTSHCIFIEDGSDRFIIDNVTIIDSDSDGIHIGGTAIVGGRIIDCTILNVDDNGIQVDMDGGADIATNMLFTITSIFNAGVNGVLLSDVHDSQITDFIITSAVGDGIQLLVDCDDNSITDNLLTTNGAYGINIAGGTCNGNHVVDNTFNGNVTAPVANSGTNTEFHTKQYFVAGDDDVINQTPGKSITNGQTAYIAVHAPVGLQQITAFNIYVIPNATQANANWDLATSYGGNGEANNIHSEAEAAATYNVTDLQWFEIDAFGAGMFASLEEEDTGGISVTVSGVGHNVTVVMAEMYYV